MFRRGRRRLPLGLHCNSLSRKSAGDIEKTGHGRSPSTTAPRCLGRSGRRWRRAGGGAARGGRATATSPPTRSSRRRWCESVVPRRRLSGSGRLEARTQTARWSPLRCSAALPPPPQAVLGRFGWSRRSRRPWGGGQAFAARGTLRTCRRSSTSQHSTVTEKAAQRHQRLWQGELFVACRLAGAALLDWVEEGSAVGPRRR